MVLLISGTGCNLTQAAATRDRNSDTDIVGLLEVNNRWLEALAPLRGRYSYRVEAAREDNSGIALYSRTAFETSEVITLSAGQVDVVEASLKLGRRKVSVLLARPFPPLSQRYAAIRNAQLDEFAAQRSQRAGEASILFVDLNITPWSPYFENLLEATKLRSAAKGARYLPTWPSDYWPMRISIDHAFVSEGLEVQSFRSGPDIGSDHRPIIFEVTFIR